MYDFTGARDFYREATKSAGIGMHHELVRKYIELQALLLTPIAPHWAEYMWLEVLGKPSTIQNELFPTVPPTVASLTAAQSYIRQTSSNITSAEGAQQKKLAKGKNVSYDPKQPKKLTIFCAQAFPAWQGKYINVVREAFEKLGLVDVKTVSKSIEKAEMKKAMPFIQGLKKRLDSGESKQEVFERKLPFDELVVLQEMVPGLKQTVQKCQTVEIITVEEGGKSGAVVGGEQNGEKRTGLPLVAEGAIPGNPTFNFENI